MLTSSSAFAAIFSRPERPPLIRGWAEFPYSTKHVVRLIGKSRFRFWICNNIRNPKMVLTLRNPSVFPFTFLLSKTGLKNCSQKQRSCTSIHYFSVEKNKYKKIYKSFIGFPNETEKEINEIRIWIFLNWNPPWGWIFRSWDPFSDFIAKSKIGISERKSKFSNRTRS